MERKTFEEIKNAISNYKYTSLNYSEYEKICDYDVVSKNKVILLYGYNKESKLYEFHWAANDIGALIEEINKLNKKGFITFVPEEWVEELKNNNFTMYAIWNEYYNYDYFKKKHLEISEEIEFLKEEECKQASELTLSCRNQSRGFTGQTEEWIKKWIVNKEPSAVNAGCKHNAVLIHRENGEIAGLVCVGVYGYNSPNGATLWIREIAVNPKYQNKGIGRQLLGQALYYGSKYDAKKSYLAADECNIHAINLYKKMGYIKKPEEREINMILE